jgi:hypothetical protein
MDKKFIPLDKSWIIRMGVLDLIKGYNDTIKFLENEKNLCEDLGALLNASKQWNFSKEIDVGESGTLFRFLQFASWKLNLNKKFIKHKTLLDRNICNNPEIVNWSLVELLRLDNNSSQWASACVLMGNKEEVSNAPFKLKLTYEAVHHWNFQRQKNKVWEVRYDKTILNQAESFIEIFKTGKTLWKPEQSEDYCFARAFDIINNGEGEKMWPNLAGNETNRFEEMEKCLKDAEVGYEINSKDHRVVQALAMLYKLKNKPIKFKYRECVNKSWPQFWDFLESV